MKTETTELILVAENSPVATSSAESRKKELLAYAATIQSVKSDADAQFAGDALHQLDAFSKEIEASRVSAKAPFLEVERAIDALGKSLASEVIAEKKRISASLGAWQENQRRIAQEIQRKAWEAEKEARLEAARKEMWAEIDEADEEQHGVINQEFTQKVATIREQAVAAAPVKVAGISARSDVEYEVTDLQALYEASPFLVTLTPNRAAIKSAVKALRDDQVLPGIKWWRTASVSVRK